MGGRFGDVSVGLELRKGILMSIIPCWSEVVWVMGCFLQDWVSLGTEKSSVLYKFIHSLIMNLCLNSGILFEFL